MKIKIFIKRLFLGLVTVFVLGSIVFGLLIKKSLPKDDGILSSTHLKAEVHVYKDQWGIPHINASNEHDAIFAYGYTVAKDRLFQMDLQVLFQVVCLVQMNLYHGKFNHLRETVHHL